VISKVREALQKYQIRNRCLIAKRLLEKARGRFFHLCLAHALALSFWRARAGARQRVRNWPGSFEVLSGGKGIGRLQ
jgi:hypothetical protein